MFSSIQWTLLCVSVVLVLVSLWEQSRGASSKALLLLTFSALSFYAFVALFDPFLHIWDERFHALVAKNLSHHPLLPTLYDNPVVSMAYDRWDRAIVWLHKQPLFLWQIALSLKVWGCNTFGLRFPSVIMASLLLPITYRVGKLLGNDSVGFISAAFMLSSFYTVQLVSGVQGMEHNDLAFLFYVSASIWAWVEYEFAEGYKKWRWALLIGLFSGAAILCKWLVGLLVYAAFSSQILTDFNWKRIGHVAVALLVTTLMVLPWQLLSFSWYPAEAAFEMKYNALHFTDAIEGHGGEWLFHWEKIPVLFGSAVQVLLIPAFLGLILTSTKKRVAAAFVLLPILTYVFYSLASTKMQSYPYVVAMPIYVSMAFLVNWFIQRLKGLTSSKVATWLSTILLVVSMVFNLNIKELLLVHTSWYGYNEYHEELSKNRLIFLELKEELPVNSVLFNVSGRHYVEAMFYTDFPAYEMMPGTIEIQQVLDADMVPVVLNDERVELPIELTTDNRVLVVDQRIHSYY